MIFECKQVSNQVSWLFITYSEWKASVNLMQGHSGPPLSRSDGPDETCLQ